jgi:putative hydrolase of the HAD superfamily
MIKTIILDWHGVIDRKTFEKFVALTAKEISEEPNKCKERIKEITTAWTIGTLEPQLFWSQLQSLLNLKDEQIQKLKGYILNIDFDEEVVEFLEKSQNNYRLALLSDCPPDKANVIRTSKVFPLFETASFSCDKHFAKENPKFFLDFIKELNLPANECIYVDDNKRHIDTASSLGMNVCLFTEIRDLTSSLPTKL